MFERYQSKNDKAVGLFIWKGRLHAYYCPMDGVEVDGCLFRLSNYYSMESTFYSPDEWNCHYFEFTEYGKKHNGTLILSIEGKEARVFEYFEEPDWVAWDKETVGTYISQLSAEYMRKRREDVWWSRLRRWWQGKFNRAEA